MIHTTTAENNYNIIEIVQFFKQIQRHRKLLCTKRKWDAIMFKWKRNEDTDFWESNALALYINDKICHTTTHWLSPAKPSIMEYVWKNYCKAVF